MIKKNVQGKCDLYMIIDHIMKLKSKVFSNFIDTIHKQICLRSETFFNQKRHAFFPKSNYISKNKDTCILIYLDIHKYNMNYQQIISRKYNEKLIINDS